jgi:hypothetical protein
MTVGILPRATAGEARELTDRINTVGEDTLELIKDAYRARAWIALNYPTWDDYCTREFQVKPSKKERQAMVASMRETGMSTQAMAVATGVTDRTIVNDLHTLQGTPAKPKRPRREPRASPRVSLIAQFQLASNALDRAVSKLERLQNDDRLGYNRAKVREVCGPELTRCATALNALLDAL